MNRKKTIAANWSDYDLRPTWSVISSRELSQILSVSLQTINNWHIRGILPSPVSHPKLKGNKNYFRISSIKSWLENRPEDEIHWEWVKNHIPFEIEKLSQAVYVAQHAFREIGIERPVISLED